MASKTRSSSSKRSGRKSASARKSTGARKGAAAAAKSNGGQKREAQKANDVKLRSQVVKLRKSDTSWGDIADQLKITPGKAQFLMMQHEVEQTPALAIKHSNEKQLVAGIKKARQANDEHSSWGWIAARTGVSEGRVKSLAEANGITVKGTNVASARAGTATKAAAKKSTGTARKGSAARRGKGRRGR